MLYLAGVDLLLGNPAGLTGMCINQRKGTGLNLPRTPRCYQNVPVIAIETILQIHALHPVLSLGRTGDSLAERE